MLKRLTGKDAMSKHWSKTTRAWYCLFSNLNSFNCEVFAIAHNSHGGGVVFFISLLGKNGATFAEYQQKLTALFPETKLPKYAVFATISRFWRSY